MSWASRRANRRARRARDRAKARERLIRPVGGPCPGCGAKAGAWCVPTCNYVDPIDWR